MKLVTTFKNLLNKKKEGKKTNEKSKRTKKQK